MAFAARVLEVWIILRFLGLPATWDMVLPIEAASTLIDAVLFFVPGKIGTQEGGKMVIFLMLGLPPEKGLAMGLIRRGRALFWDVAGLAIYAVVRSRLGARDALTGSGTP